MNYTHFTMEERACLVRNKHILPAHSTKEVSFVPLVLSQGYAVVLIDTNGTKVADIYDDRDNHAVVDSNGSTVVEYKYDAWGNHKVLDANGNEITSSTHIGNLNPFRYCGYYYDIETGFYFLKSRYYDPEVGRFLNIDSLDYADPETINGLNLYAYCGDNPVMGYDPEGIWSWSGFWNVIAAVAVVVVVTAAVALTAGAAAVAVGASSAVGTTVALTAVAAGTVVGVGEVVNQTLEKGSENINLGSVAISTFSGAADGALVAGSLFTNPVGTAAIWGGRVLLSGAISIGYGLNEDYSSSDIALNFAGSVSLTATLGQFMFNAKALSLSSIILKPFVTAGAKLGSAMLKNLWNHLISPLLD